MEEYAEDAGTGHGDGSLAYEQLKEHIISCTLSPGVRVTEAGLATALGLGKTPVREALLRLQNEGLVRAIPRQGYRVTPITLRDVQDICQLRLILEPAGAQLAAGRVDADTLSHLDRLCQVGVAPGDHRGAAALLRANSAFHLTIARAAGNRQLVAITAGILARMERVFHLSLVFGAAAEISHEHRDLVEALVAGDGEGARRIMAARLQASQRTVTAALLSSPQLLSVNVAAAGHGEEREDPAATLGYLDGSPLI